MLALSPSDDAQRDELLALFDRREAYGQWRDTAQALHADDDQLVAAAAAVFDALHAAPQSAPGGLP